MIYKCNECGNEFDWIIPEHHFGTQYAPTRFGPAAGCPVCQQMQSMPKKCPKCQSLDVSLSIKINIQ